MAVTVSVFNNYKAKLLSGANAVDWDADTIKVSLHTSTYTPNIDTHDFFDDATNEVSAGSGYTAGGETIAGLAVAIDTTGDFGYVDGTDTTWTALTKTFRYGVVYKDTGVPGTSPLIMLIDFGADQSPAGIDFTLIWAAPASGGILKAA